MCVILFIDPSHHTAASVSLVVSVPLSSGVNLSTAAIPSHHQIPNIKSFANSELTPVNIQFILVDFSIVIFEFVFFKFSAVCVRIFNTLESAYKSIS